MSIKELKSKKLLKEYLVEIPYQEIDSLINVKITEIVPTVSLPGFRKGKAHIDIVKKMYEPEIRQEETRNQANMVSAPYEEANRMAAEKTNPMNAESQNPGKVFLMK